MGGGFSRTGRGAGGPAGSARVVGRSGRIVVAVLVAVAGIGGVGGAAGLFAGWADRAAKRIDGRGGLPTDCAMARRMSFKIQTACSGRLEARRQIEIRSKLDTRSNIVELVPEGKSVKAGEQLLRLNTDEIEQASREEQLAAETARAESVAADNGYEIQINENQSKLRQAESKLKLAELALEQWEKGEVVKKQQELELAIEKTADDLARLDEKVETSRKLWEKGYLSKDEFMQDQIRLTEARSAAKSATMEEEIYRVYKKPEEKETKTSALAEARSELERVKMNNKIELASKESARTTKRTQLEIHERRLQDLRKQVEEASIKAPVDGLVVYAFSMGLGWRETPLQIGQPVYRNELVMILPDTSEMVASVGVHESLAGKVQKGQAVDVKVEAAGSKVFKGEVESLSVLAETDDGHDKDTREYKVKVALEAQSVRGFELKPSMRVDATITLGEVADALAVPVQAIFNEGALRYVCERRGGVVAKVPVKVGRMSSTYAEITAGLGEGAVVLLRDPHAGEVQERAWDVQMLSEVGIEMDAEGRPFARPDPVTAAAVTPSSAPRHAPVLGVPADRDWADPGV